MDAEKIKILLVDDSPEDREVTKIQLCRRNKDLVCIEFESADAAIPSFSAESYDCILSDFQMPGKDGLDFLKFVRSEVGDIPFIFYTGQGNEEIAASAFRMGADDYFTKEIGFAHYQRLINSIIRLVNAHKTRINRSKAEVALKESEERFRILAESAFDGVIVHQNGKIVYSNQGTAETFGYEISDIVGSEFLGFVAEESKSLVNDKVRSASEEPYEAICIRKDGTRIPVEVCGREIVAGGSRGRVVALRDLSKREERKEALRRSEEKYRALFNNANDAIYLWELNNDGGPGKCLDVNDVACRRMGYSREEFLKMTPVDIDDMESANKIPEVMKRLFESGNVTFEVNHVTKSGEKFPAEISSHIFTFEGKKVILSLARDISERKAAQRALEEHKSQEAALLEAIPDLIFRMSREGKFLGFYPSKEIPPILPTEQFLGKHLSEVLPQDLAETASDHYEKTFTTGKMTSFEYSLPGENEIKFFESRQILYNENELLVLVRDVTDRVKSAEALRESEQLFSLHIHQAPLAFIEWDLGLKVTDWNPTSEKIFGYSKEEALGRAAWELIIPESAKPVVEEVWNSLITGKGGTRSLNENIRKDGKTILCDWYNTPIVNADNEVIRVASFVEDVTERERSEKVQKVLYNILKATTKTETLEDLISQIHKEISTLMDASNFYVALYDKETDRYTFPYLKDTEEVLDIHKPISLKGGLTDYVRLKEAPVLITKKEINELIESGEMVKIGAQPESWLGIPLVRADEPIGVVAVQNYENPNAYTNDDVEVLNFCSGNILLAIERKSAEAELKASHSLLKRKTRDLETANEELHAYSYSVSHDLRKPIQHLIGYCSILQNDFLGKLDQKGDHYLEIIKKSANNLESIVDSLLALSNIFQHELQIFKVDLSSIVTEIADALACSNPQRKITFKIAEGQSEECDLSMVRIVLDNLIGNAWKFTSETAHPVIEFGSEKKNDTKTFFVRDNGVGFDDSKSSRLFVPFQRLSSAKKFEGTGIGLATVKRIIDRHGGRIWAESQPGKGATFYFTLK